MSLKLGLFCNKHKLCCSDFNKDLPSHSHSENNLKNLLLDNLLRPQHSNTLLERERDFKKISFATLKDVENNQRDRMPTETDVNWENT